MPIIENYDGTFDIRNAKSGEIVRTQDGRALALTVEKVDPTKEAWLAQRADRDNYFRVIVKTTCARCGASFQFNRGRDNARATFPKTCKKHRGMTAGVYNRLLEKGTLAQVEDRRKYPVVYPDPLEAGAFVSFRNLAYVILAVRQHVSLRTGKESVLLDLAGRCVCCGKEFPHTCTLEGKPLPLRCEACQERLGSGWRYSPVKDVGSPQYLGVQPNNYKGVTAEMCADETDPGDGFPIARKVYGSLREYQQSKESKDD